MQRPIAGRNNSQGNSIAELPLVLMVLLFLMFFPLLDLINISFNWAACALLNDIQLREAACDTEQAVQDPLGNVKSRLPAAWRNGPLGRYCSITTEPRTTVTYRDLVRIRNRQLRTVSVRTEVTCRPLLLLPLPPIPGLSANLPLTIERQRPVEESI